MRSVRVPFAAFDPTDPGEVFLQKLIEEGKTVRLRGFKDANDVQLPAYYDAQLFKR